MNETEDNVEKDIFIFALENAISYNGEAKSGALLGKIFGKYPDTRKKGKEINEKIKKIVAEVNDLTLEQQKIEIERLAPGYLTQKELMRESRKGRHAELRPLKNAVEGKVILRFEPSPSGPLHIGHAYQLSLNYLYKKIYNGKLILRISDTNPGNIDPDAYKLIEEDASWLTSNGIDEFVVQSDRMEIYYEKALQMIEEGFAYVCICSQETFKEFVNNTEACPCRDLSSKEQLKRWNSMMHDYEQGDAVVRAKNSMTDSNPAMRDFPLLRISEGDHARQGLKYRVWPLLNFAVAIDDHEMGLTHVLRGKDHYDNTKRQKFIFDSFKWKHPEYIHTGKINFEGLKLSTTETRENIIAGKYSGWDDIRLAFLAALRRRGYVPEAIVNFARDIGTTMADKTVTAEEFFKNLNYHNKSIIEKESFRYFFIEDPVELEIENVKRKELELDLHPDYKKGGRKFTINGKFLISKKDFIEIKEGELWRLMDCLNFRRQNGKFIFDSEEYEKLKEEDRRKIIHWLPDSNKNLDLVVHMPDRSKVRGKGESRLIDLEIGTIVQFERFAFVRLDKKGKELEFYFAHK